MRRQNRASALARLDKPKVLRPVFRTFREDALVWWRVSQRWAFISRVADRSRVQAQAVTARDSAPCYIAVGERIEQSVSRHGRTTLHVWCANKERHALLETCSWSSALLATQRREGNAATGEALD
jgi:hypothetical protein